MKKRLLVAMLAVSMVMSLTACGAKSEENASAETDTQQTDAQQTGQLPSVEDKTTLSSKDFDAVSLATLGDYENLEVAVDTYNFSDADVETRMNADFESFVMYADKYEYTAKDKDTIEEGDLVNLDYCGKKDGVAFDGGTAEGAHLEIGSHTFIEGFEEGMVGHKVGESFDIPLTFPENYQAEELAGQAVVFEIKVNSIDDKKMPELTDEIVTQMGMEYQTVADYKEYVKNYLQNACDSENASASETAIWEAVYGACDVKDVPQELIDDAKNRIQENTESYASYNGVSVEEFVAQNMKATMEEFEKQKEDSALISAKEKILVAAIANKAGIVLSDEDLRAAAESECAEYGYETVDEMFADVGSGPYYDYVLQKKVNEYLAGVVKVKKNDPKSIMEIMNY